MTHSYFDARGTDEGAVSRRRSGRDRLVTRRCSRGPVDNDVAAQEAYAVTLHVVPGYSPLVQDLAELPPKQTSVLRLPQPQVGPPWTSLGIRYELLLRLCHAL